MVGISDYFGPENLKSVFYEKIVKSSAVGMDGMKLGSFIENFDREAGIILRKISAGSYRFTRYREKLISKGFGKLPRQLSIPSVRDRLVLRVLSNMLRDEFSSSNIPPPHVYIKECCEAISVARENSSFLRMDIKDFYPTVLHPKLEKILEKSAFPDFATSLIMESVSNPTGNIARPDRGIPQGLSISNSLASIYLHEMDLKFRGEFFYRRYVDDILVISGSERVSAIYKEIAAHLSEFGLSPHPLGTPGKSDQSRLGDGTEYLGYVLRPGNISIRKSSIDRMFSNILKIITQIKYNKKNLDRSIFRLNLKISGCLVNGGRRGWMMFFAQSDDLAQISYLDKFVADNLRLIGIDPLANGVKRFLKSYHEIRYNIGKSKYIPNFDAVEIDEKVRIISLLTGKSLEELGTRSVEEIEREYNKVIAREVSDLEKDVVGAFS